jgi:hypothetical protein
MNSRWGRGGKRIGKRERSVVEKSRWRYVFEMRKIGREG